MKIKEVIDVNEGRLLVLPDEQSDLKTDSGITIETNQESLPHRTGTIVKVGFPLYHPGIMELVPNRYKEGERIAYEPRQMVEIKLDGVEHQIIQPGVILFSFKDGKD